MREFKDSNDIVNMITKVARDNRDHHVIFSQIGEAVGFIDERTIISAFLSTWCEKYKSTVDEILKENAAFLPRVH